MYFTQESILQKKVKFTCPSNFKFVKWSFIDQKNLIQIENLHKKSSHGGWVG